MKQEQLCACGCGERTAGGTHKVGHSKRVESRARGPKWLEQERGYDTPCWIWQRYCDRKGYAVGWDPASKTMSRIHVLNYTQAHGPVPKGKQLDHLCRQRSCVNPDHLEPVTNAENGRRGGATILSADEVRAIRASLRQGTKGRDIARAYGVSPATISAINVGRLWRDVV